MLLQPKEITLTDQSGKERNYTISKFDCISGREIVAKYPVSQIPKIGDYAVSEETMLKLMAFVNVNVNGQQIPLNSAVLVKNHVPDWETLIKLEREMLSYNCSFFYNGKGLTSLAELTAKAAAWASKISMASLAQLLQEVRQHSMSSEQSTPSRTDSFSGNA